MAEFSTRKLRQFRKLMLNQTSNWICNDTCNIVQILVPGKMHNANDYGMSLDGCEICFGNQSSPDIRCIECNVIARLSAWLCKTCLGNRSSIAFDLMLLGHACSVTFSQWHSEG